MGNHMMSLYTVVVCMKMAPHRRIRGGTIRRCGLVGEGVALLEEVCH